MADNIKDYILRVKLDTSGLTQQFKKATRDIGKEWKQQQRKMQSDVNKMVTTRQVSRGAFSETTTAANIMEGSRRSISSARQHMGGSVDEGLSSSINRLNQIQGRVAGAKSRADVAKLKADYREATQQVRRLVREQENLNKKLSIGAEAGSKFGSSMKRAALQVASVYAAFEAGRVMFTIGKDMDSMRAGLLAASDNAKDAKDNFEFLKETANTLGQDVQVGVRGFNKLAVAAKGAGLSGEQAKEIFLAASEASTTAQLSTDRANLVMFAMSQMMSYPISSYTQ